jgi:hypothetical protein
VCNLPGGRRSRLELSVYTLEVSSNFGGGAVSPGRACLCASSPDWVDSDGGEDPLLSIFPWEHIEGEFNVDVEVGVGVDGSVTNTSCETCELCVGGSIWIPWGSETSGAPLKTALIIFSTEKKPSRLKSMILTSLWSWRLRLIDVCVAFLRGGRGKVRLRQLYRKE